MAMTDQNRSKSTAGPAQLMVQEVWSRGDLALVDELVTDYVRYDPALSDPVDGPEALKQTVAQYRRGVPDLTKTIEETIVDGSAVVIHYTATGTHEGALLGIDPTSREFEVDGVFTSRAAAGGLTRATDIWDGIGLLQQIGAGPDSSLDTTDSSTHDTDHG